MLLFSKLEKFIVTGHAVFNLSFACRQEQLTPLKKLNRKFYQGEAIKEAKVEGVGLQVGLQLQEGD